MAEVVVVGGGIAGLTAAHELEKLGLRTTVLEAAAQVGGKIRTTEFGGRPVDEGADMFLAREPWAVELCDELGMRDELTPPATTGASIWRDGRLRRIPRGHVLGVPFDFEALAETDLLDPADLARAAREPELPGEPLTGDESIGSLVRRRFGDGVAAHLLAPLVSGVHAGDIDRLSVEIVAPRVADAARRGPSVARGLRDERDRDRPGPSAPLFLAPRGGMGRLVQRLTEELADRIQTGVAVEAVRASRGGHHIDTSEGEISATGVIVAAPAWAASLMLADLCPEAAVALGSIDYAPVALATLGYPAGVGGTDFTGSGFLVDPSADLMMTACSWGSLKWPAWSPPDRVVLRVSAGHRGDHRPIHLDDCKLLAQLRADLRTTVGMTAEPAEVRITRYPHALPQFDVDHLSRVERIEHALGEAAARVVLTGSSYRGLGVPACIRQAREAAALLQDRLG